mmetsp:Transcript_34174/g.73980  ORF Transcript_34174/g.73980 Transcript_34174/m.73980 type:complete len:162 (-) Transcript_34174:895-1380(-)
MITFTYHTIIIMIIMGTSSLQLSTSHTCTGFQSSRRLYSQRSINRDGVAFTNLSLSSSSNNNDDERRNNADNDDVDNDVDNDDGGEDLAAKFFRERRRRRRRREQSSMNSPTTNNYSPSNEKNDEYTIMNPNEIPSQPIRKFTGGGSSSSSSSSSSSFSLE